MLKSAVRHRERFCRSKGSRENKGVVQNWVTLFRVSIGLAVGITFKNQIV